MDKLAEHVGLYDIWAIFFPGMIGTLENLLCIGSLCIIHSGDAFIKILAFIPSTISEWIVAMKEILQGSEKCFYILTTGLYYEAHVTGNSESLKSTHTPTIEELIEWERGLK